MASYKTAFKTFVKLLVCLVLQYWLMVLLLVGGYMVVSFVLVIVLVLWYSWGFGKGVEKGGKRKYYTKLCLE